MCYSAFTLWFDHFLDTGADRQKFVKFFVGFLKNLKNQKDILNLTDL